MLEEELLAVLRQCLVCPAQGAWLLYVVYQRCCLDSMIRHLVYQVGLLLPELPPPRCLQEEEPCCLQGLVPVCLYHSFVSGREWEPKPPQSSLGWLRQTGKLGE